MDNTQTTTPDTERTEMKVYRVETFLPTNCPKCERRFEREATDWSRLLGDIVNGEKRIRETRGYVIIICAHCRNYTAQVSLESYQLASKEQAEKLCAEKGFVNLQSGMAFGNHCRDIHTKSVSPDGSLMVTECPKCRHKFSEVNKAEIITCPQCENKTYGYACKDGPNVIAVKCDE